MRADLFLVEHGFATTRSQAQRLIGCGVQWRAEADAPWKRVAKNGDEVPFGAEVVVLDNTEAKYISRGGLKLEGALAATGLSVTGLRCLDIGQSTGGFTDCLLQHGAVQVVGVDVGHGQLHDSLRNDPRVVCIEGLNARSMTADDLIATESVALQSVNTGTAHDFDDEDEQELPEGEAIDPVFDFLTGDLSFISLTLVLPAVTRLLKPQGHLLMLVKPQFELQPGQVGKGGIVRDTALFDFVEKRVKDAPLRWAALCWAGLSPPLKAVTATASFLFMPKKARPWLGKTSRWPHRLRARGPSVYRVRCSTSATSRTTTGSCPCRAAWPGTQQTP